MKIKPGASRGGVTMEITAPEETRLLAAEPRSFVHIRKILVPVDFSGCSRRAVEYGVAFAHQFGAEALLVHVVELDYAAIEMSPLDITSVQRQVTENVRAKLAKLVEDLDVTRVSIQTRVRAGSVRSEILKEADEFDPDLIIVGTDGTTGLKHTLLGSVAEAVVRHARCPALTVRETKHEIINL